MPETEKKIFQPGNHREAPERALRGELVDVVDDRGWEKQIKLSSGVKLWVANGELLPAA